MPATAETSRSATLTLVSDSSPKTAELVARAARSTTSAEIGVHMSASIQRILMMDSMLDARSAGGIDLGHAAKTTRRTPIHCPVAFSADGALQWWRERPIGYGQKKASCGLWGNETTRRINHSGVPAGVCDGRLVAG